MFIYFRCGHESDSDPDDSEHAEKLRHVKTVLEEVLVIVIKFKQL